MSRFGRFAVVRGLSGGGKPWLYAGLVASSFRVVKRFVGRTEDVHRIRLRPGEALEIREIPRETRRA